MTWWRTLSTALFLVAFALPPCVARASTNDWSDVDLRRHRLARICRMNVEDANGEKIGRLKDLILDARLTQLKYGIIDWGGVAGVATHRKIVPAYALSLGTAKRNVLALDTVRATWNQTPAFKRSSLVRLQDPNWIRQLTRLYPEPSADEKLASLTPPHEIPHPFRHTNSTRLVFVASELVGLPLVNGVRETLGEVVDLLVDFDDERLPLAIVASRLGGPRRTYVVPLASLRVIPRESLLVNLDSAAFERARTFDFALWRSLESGTVSVYRYDDSRTDGAGHLTVGDQSNHESDRHLTQLIRQAIVNSSQLSLTAKNVKVITIAGQVTLRGGVHTRAEKERIAGMASQIAGADKVTDQIELIGR